MFTVCTSVRESPARHSSLSSPLSTQTSNTLDISGRLSWYGFTGAARWQGVGSIKFFACSYQKLLLDRQDRTLRLGLHPWSGRRPDPSLALGSRQSDRISSRARSRPYPTPYPPHTNERENCTLWRSEPKPCTQTIESETAHSGTHSGTLARCTARARLAVHLAETSGSRERTTARAHHGAQATGARALCRCFMISRARTA